MEPKEAVKAAKAFFLDIVGEESTLEEVWFDDKADEWCVTFGIRHRSVGGLRSVSGILQPKEVADYKVVRLRNKDGSFVSIRNREGQRAA